MSQSSNDEKSNSPQIPLADHQINAEPESVTEVFHDLLGVKSKFRKLRSFFRTRRTIIKGEYLFDRPADEIRQQNLMGPLTFNIYSSTIAGTIALGASKLFSFYFPTDNAARFFPRNVIPQNALSAEFMKLLPQVDSFMQPFLVPIVFLFVAYCVSWGTIRGKEPRMIGISNDAVSRLPPSRTRGRNAFLYFDGAYGFIPQALLSISLTLFRSVGSVSGQAHSTAAIKSTGNGATFSTAEMITPLFSRFTPIIAVIVLMIFVTVLYSAYLTYYKFPRLMFRAHGYYRTAEDSSPARIIDTIADRPPWAKYILTAIFIVPVVTLSISLLFGGVVYILARFLAIVFTFLHGNPLT